jgi:AcrR family transcriptional regulator
MSNLEPRKTPRQGRSKVTVDAILEACADGLSTRGYEALTTNAIAERAGVSVGTLYQYFPNREAIAAALAQRAFQRLVQTMREALETCVAQRMGHLQSAEHMLVCGLKVLNAEGAVFRVLALEAPQVFRLPAVRAAQATLIDLPQEMRVMAGDRLELPMPEADAWLIGHMISASMFQISLLDASEAEQIRLAREVARLSCRMSLRPELQMETAPARAAAE